MSSSSSSGGRTTYKDEIHVKGRYGTETFRRDDEPDIGIAPIEYVAQFDGVVNFRDEAYMGPVSVGRHVAEEFRDDVEDRLSNVEFHDFEEGS